MKFVEIFNIEELTKLCQNFSEIHEIATAIMDIDGKFHVATGWQPICKKFHRINKHSYKRCVESDLVLASSIKEGDNYKIYKCLNGLMEIAIPINIRGKKTGVFFAGQFLTSPPDIEFFRKQAIEFGFSETEYLQHLSKVTIISEDKVHKLVNFLITLTQIIGNKGLVNIENQEKNKKLEIESEEIKLAWDKANENEKMFRKLFQTTTKGYWLFDKDSKFIDVNEAYCDMSGYTREELLNMQISDIEEQEKEEDIRQHMKRIQKKGYDIFETRHRKKDGTVYPVEIHVSFVNVNHGMYIVFINDLTNIKNHERELIRAKERAESSENKLLILINTMPDLIWLKDTNGIFIQCNNRFEELMGVSRNEILGKTDFDFFDKELADFFRENDIKAMNAGKSLRNEELLTFASDGHQEFTETIKTPLFNSEGGLIGVIGIGRDISARKKAEQDLIIAKSVVEENQERYHLLYESSKDGIALLSLEGIFIDVNPAFCTMTGYSKEELNTKNIYQLIPEYLHKWQEAELYANQQMNYGLAETLQKEFLNKNGITFPVEITSYKVKLSNNQEIIWSVIKDLSRIKKAESHAEILLKAVEAVKAIVMIFDNNGIIEYVNPYFTENTGFSKEETIGKTAEFLSLGLQHEEINNEIRKVISENKTWSGEVYSQNTKGFTSVYQITISPLINDITDEKKYIFVGADITQQKELDKKILQTIIETEEKDKEYFAQEIHDGLGPVLSAIRLYTQWHSEQSSEEERKFINEKTLELINEATNLVRNISFSLSPYTLQNFGLLDALNSFAGKIKETGNVDIQISSDSKIKLNHLIETTIYRILIECINNSLKHSGANLITISLNTGSGSTKINYADNGIGFDVDAIMKSKKGIGLFNMQSRIKALNGSFKIISEQNKGTKIEIVIKSL